MSKSETHIHDPSVLRLTVVVSDTQTTTALVRLLQIFQDRDVNPRKVASQRILLHSQNREVVHVDIEFGITDLTMERLRFVAASIARMPMTLSTVFGTDPTDRPPVATVSRFR